MKVVVVGGGITGLSVAHFLEVSQLTKDVVLLEAQPRLGGNIRTERREAYVIDAGPDSWVTTKPFATNLARDLGLTEDLISTHPANRRVYVAWDKELHRLPEGLVLGVPTRIMPMVTTPLFSWDAKLRMGLEPLVPRREFHGDDDESIASFLGRRFGDELVERLAGPLLGGIFAGDAETLSIRATFPQFVEAEQKHGSLIRAMRATRPASRSADEPPPSPFMSLKSGMGDLITTLAHKLKDAVVHRDARVCEVARLESGRYAVVTEAGAVHEADQVVLATPSYVTARCVRGLDSTLAELMDQMRYASTSTVFLAFKRDHVDHPLDATGFIVPRAARRPMLACTWVSSKWEHRAPAGRVLVRVFLGGAWGEEILERDDEELVRVAIDELGAFIGLRGRPVLTRVYRFVRASPQPSVGHLGRMRRVRERLAALPGLHVAGSGLDGVGIPDCIKQAEAIVQKMVLTSMPSAARG
jgi:oxygen-dependent protoporphyrinogen oxidase